jgi:hypothetical protein
MLVQQYKGNIVAFPWQQVTMLRYKYIAYIVDFHYSVYGTLIPISRSFKSICFVSEATMERFIKTCVQSVILFGCETWSLLLREEHRLKVFENRVLRKIFGPKR